MWTVTSSHNLITFKSLKRGLVCSKNISDLWTDSSARYKQELIFLSCSARNTRKYNVQAHEEFFKEYCADRSAFNSCFYLNALYAICSEKKHDFYFRAQNGVTKNCCVTYVKIHEYANFIVNLPAYLISAVSLWFSNSILSRLRMLLLIVPLML